MKGNLIVKGDVNAPLAIKGKVGKNIIFKDESNGPVAFQNTVGGNIFQK